MYVQQKLGPIMEEQVDLLLDFIHWRYHWRKMKWSIQALSTMRMMINSVLMILTNFHHKWRNGPSEVPLLKHDKTFHTGAKRFSALPRRMSRINCIMVYQVTVFRVYSNCMHIIIYVYIIVTSGS